ncbi:glycosyltransferase family 39 protein [Acetobacteraceae bacterium]|nr:glycosyltransferase family 39 protein [Acetobacteraceae bacterium]
MIQKKNKMKDIEDIFKKYFCFVFILIFFLIHLYISANFPLTPDEAYYWLWSHSLQLGYPDHPPMVAYWIKAGSALFGETAFGIRFFAVCSVTLTTFFLWKAASNFFGESEGKWIVYLFTCTLFSNVISLIITPDTPAIFFLSTGLWITSYLLKNQEQKEIKYFLLFLLLGFFLGLSFLSKYTAILVIVGIYFSFVFTTPSLFFKKEIYFSCLTFFLTISPNIFWNFQNHGSTFEKQGHRLCVSEGRIGAHYLELIGGQVGLITPVIFLLVFVAFLQKVERKKEKVFLIYALLPSILFFLLYPLHARVQANWPFITWPTCLLIGTFATRSWKVVGCIVGITCVSVVYVQAIFHLFPLDAHYDPILRQSAGWKNMARDLEKKIPSGEILEAEDYALGAILAYHLKDSNISVGSTDKKIQFLRAGEITTKNVRSIREIRNNFRVGSEDTLCRYQYVTKSRSKVRCYSLEEERTKKISLFF